MAFLSTQDGARAILRWAGPFGFWSNHLWFRKPEFTPIDMLALADIFKNIWTATQSIYTSDQVSCLRTEVIDERVQGGALVQNTNGIWGGTESSHALPPSTCLVLTLRTESRGRAYRGRLYLTGIAESDWQPTGFASRVLDGWESWADSLQAAAEAIGWMWGVRSAQFNGVPRPQAIITPIVGWDARSVRPGQQRRRNQRP